MSDRDRRPYVIDGTGYVHGPYKSESAARSAALDGDSVQWLHASDIHPDYGTLAG